MNVPAVWSEDFARVIRAALVENLPIGPGAEAHLQAGINVLGARPGKLVRARLVLGTTLAHGVDPQAGVALATAIEYFHLASLLLDDLPCMDDATTRRGQPCLHRMHGEATAILTALAFINRAYALVGFGLASQPVAVRLQAQACLDASLGWAGLIGGQAHDLRFAESDRSARTVSRIALAKTGTLFSVGLIFPALLARPEREERRALEALCLYWSLAFQALDDMQDVLATSVDAGKTTGRDRTLSRPNLAVVLGIPPTRRRIVRLLGQSARQIQRLTRVRPAWAYLEQFQQYFVDAAAPVAGDASASAA